MTDLELFEVAYKNYIDVYKNYIDVYNNYIDVYKNYIEQNKDYFVYQQNACEQCPNNPNNGGSGICHCILGSPVIN